MKKIKNSVLKYLKSDSNDSIVVFYRIIGYMLVGLQIFLWSQAFWLSLIETVSFLIIITKSIYNYQIQLLASLY